MYEITVDIADHLLKYAKDPEIVSVGDDEISPFVAKNKHTIGFLDPTMVTGSEFDYIVESDYPISEANFEHLPDIQGFWLYKKEELRQPEEKIEVLRGYFDPNVTTEEVLDITDCCVIPKSSVEKLTCTKIKTLDRLFELEPKIRECLDMTKKMTRGYLQ